MHHVPPAALPGSFLAFVMNAGGRGHGDGNVDHKWLVVVEIGESSIFGPETDGLLFVRPGAEQVQAMAGEGEIVGWICEQ